MSENYESVCKVDSIWSVYSTLHHGTVCQDYCLEYYTFRVESTISKQTILRIEDQERTERRLSNLYCNHSTLHSICYWFIFWLVCLLELPCTANLKIAFSHILNTSRCHWN